jgi:hypothetical protein
MTTPLPSAYNREYDHIPVGTVIPFAGVVLPSPKWRWCDSTPVVQADYPALHAVISPQIDVPGLNTIEAYITGAANYQAGYIPSGPTSGGVMNYSLTLTQNNIPPFAIDYGGSSWSASLPHTGILNGDETVTNDTTGNWVQYYSSDVHRSSEVTFNGLQNFAIGYKQGGVATPITGTVNIPDATLPTIKISFIIKAL